MTTGIPALVVAAYDDLQRHAAHTGKGQQRIGNLTHLAFHLHHLPMALLAIDVEQQQARRGAHIIQSPMPEGRSEDQVRQLIRSQQLVLRSPLPHSKPRSHSVLRYLVGSRLRFIGANPFNNGFKFSTYGRQ